MTGAATAAAERLEILVFTYNRAEKLRRTLAALRDSPFAYCRITVLDNCSPDHTPDVCREFESELDRLRVVRHTRNIGLGANYLRAVELSRAPYSWILSDDERLDFDDVGDVIEAVAAGDCDLISLGSPGQYEWERGLRTTTQELLGRGERYFWVWTFAAGVIFRTDLFDSHCVREGYQHLHGDYAHFPHFEFVYQCLKRDASVVTSRSEIVGRDEATVLRTASSPLAWYVEVIRPTTRIDDDDLRRAAVYQVADSRSDWLRHVAGLVAFEKVERPEAVRPLLVELATTLNGEPRRLFLLLIAPVGMIPRPVLLGLRALARAARRLGS